MSKGQPVILGVTGWKNSGKTTLTARLVSALGARGLRVSTIKHAHHAFDIDHEGTDSHTHRQAGAYEVAIVSDRRWALMHELAAHESEPTLEAMIERLSPCDIVLVEGYKRGTHPKIEIQARDARQTTPLYPDDPQVIALVNPVHDDVPENLPVFERDDIDGLCAHLLERFKLNADTQRTP